MDLRRSYFSGDGPALFGKSTLRQADAELLNLWWV